MYDHLQWNQRELDAIRTALATPAQFFGLGSLAMHRAKAKERYVVNHSDTTTGKALTRPGQSHRFIADRYGSDLLTVKNIRHENTNYNRFWQDCPQGRLADILWLIGFLKVQAAISAQFRELADTVAFETIRRVSAADRATLTEAVLALADKVKVAVPNAPYAELVSSAADEYNTVVVPSTPTLVPMDASSSDEAMRARINQRVVDMFIAMECKPVFKTLGLEIVDNYHASLVKERILRRTLTELTYYYPELTAACEHSIEEASRRTEGATVIHFGVHGCRIFAPSLHRVFAHTIKAYNDEHREGILNGTEPNLWINAAPQVIRAKVHPLAVRCLLAQFSRYEEFMGLAASFPEPMATVQGTRVRLAFLQEVQERYPELKEAVQEELRLLPVESMGGFTQRRLEALLSA